MKSTCGVNAREDKNIPERYMLCYLQEMSGLIENQKNFK